MTFIGLLNLKVLFILPKYDSISLMPSLVTQSEKKTSLFSAANRFFHDSVTLLSAMEDLL